MSELKPCYWCGGKAIIIQYNILKYCEFEIECLNEECGRPRIAAVCKKDNADSKRQEILNQWNHRFQAL